MIPKKNKNIDRWVGTNTLAARTTGQRRCLDLVRSSAWVDSHLSNLSLYRGYIGIMEKKTETTTMGYVGIIGYIWGYICNGP